MNKIKNNGRAILFNKRYLEILTRTHPLISWVMFLGIIFPMIIYSFNVIHLKWPAIVLIFVVGMLFWTIIEYLLHRFVFHFVPQTKLGKRLIYLVHANHHEYPRDKERLFMPPVPGIIIAGLFYGIIYLLAALLNLTPFVFSFFSGFLFAYLIYASMHYAIHSIKPPAKWMKPLWRNHHLHHYKDEGKGFGVSTTLWDRVFGTMYKDE